MRGAASELVTPEAAAEFVAAAPGAEYVDVAEARHMVAGDRNDVFAAAILAFLDGRFGTGDSPASGTSRAAGGAPR